MNEPLEIERAYLLSELPELPEHEKLQIEQGYYHRGRIRRTTYPDGSVKCTHTVKTGEGLVRVEHEFEIDETEFERRWPLTAGHRLRKIRHKVPVGDRVWEVDQFLGPDLFLAEIELESADEKVELPEWLNRCVIREVTEDPDYRNYSIALRWRGL